MNKDFIFNNQGSSLLTVMIIITLITILSLNIWRMTMISYDISLKKQHHEQKFQIMEALMKWALDVCKNNFDILHNTAQAHKQGIHLEIPQWVNNHNVSRVDLFFKCDKENVVHITEHLSIQNSPSSCLSCYVTKEYLQDLVFYRVSGWNTHGV